MKVLFVKYNRERLAAYQTETVIFEKAGKRYVRKRAAAPEATPHVKKMIDNAKLLRKVYTNIRVTGAALQEGEAVFDYINGQSLDEKFCKAVEKRDQASLLEIINAYRNLLEGEAGSKPGAFLAGPAFHDIFGIPGEMRDVLCHPVANLDLICDNILISKEGLPWVIDYEWVFDFAVPVPFLLYRGIGVLYAKYGEYLGTLLPFGEALKNAGLDEGSLQLFSIWEKNFQQYVFGAEQPFQFEERYVQRNPEMEELKIRLDQMTTWAQKASRDVEDRDATIWKLGGELERGKMAADALIEHQRKQLDNSNRQMDEIRGCLRESDQRVTVQRHELRDLRNQVEEYERALHRLLHSRSWKATRPLRKAISLLSGRKEEAFHIPRSADSGPLIDAEDTSARQAYMPPRELQPVHDLMLTPESYVSTGEDPQFLIDIIEKNPTDAHWRIRFGIIAEDFKVRPQLYLDDGEGFSELNSYHMSADRNGRVDFLFSVTSRLKRLRLDPGFDPGRFRISDFQLNRYDTKDDESPGTMPRPASYDILCFPIIDWHFRLQRPQQILSRLAKKGHRVFYLSSRLSGLGAEAMQADTVEENVLLLSMPGNSRFNIYRHIPSDNTVKQGVEALSDFLIGQDCGEVVLLVHLPFWTPYAEALKERFGWPIVYDCMDEHSGFETNTGAMVSAEARLIDSADLVVVSSLPLQKKLASRRSVHVLRNAADYGHFSRLPSREQGPLAELNSPVIGYYGAIAEWFDLPALERALSERPEWTFVLIGHVSDARINELDRYPNLKLLGEKPYTELPSYLSGFDVCVIPFKRTPLTEATNPVKVYEYLASGKPVVARRLPELEVYEKDIFLYEQPADFIVKIEQALKENSESSRRKRQDIAVANRWEQRVDAFHDLIQGQYGKASIIIVSYQGLHYLRTCVQSIIRYTGYPNYEVIIVDNGSDSSVVAYLQQIERMTDSVKVIYNAENRGFAAANNQGLNMAKDSDFFVLLNNDTAVTPGWLSRLIFYARRQEVGLVGPVTNFIGNEARIQTQYRDLDEMVRFARRIYSSREPEYFDCDVLAMFCVAFRKEVIEQVGLLDERFGIGMFEDDDYAKRVRQAGYRVICAEDVFVHHFGSVSLSRLDERQYRELFELNRLKYEEKWGPWKPHRYREGM